MSTIYGTVSPRHEAVVSLRLRGPTGTELVTEAVVDSGFTGPMTVPMSVVAALGLPYDYEGQAALADGSLRLFDVCTAEVEWVNGWVTTEVYMIGSRLLVGMDLLDGCRLTIEAIVGGSVEITPLPSIPY